MPEAYYVPYDEPGSLGEQLVGKGDSKRTTKTFIDSGALALRYALLRGYPDMILTVGRRLHAEQTGIPFKEITNEMILEEYPEAKELVLLHQQSMEHLGSVQGFLVDRLVRSSSIEEMKERQERKESSGDPGGGSKRWG